MTYDAAARRPASPPAGPRARRSGCLVPLVVFVGFAVAGFAVAASVRGNDDDGTRVTLEEGELGGRSYRIEGVTDEQGARCVQLLRDDKLNTGACDTSANEALVGDRSVIFGQAPARAVSVRVPLSNRDRGSAEVDERDGFHWYAFDVASDVDIDGEPTFVDADGGTG